MIFNKTPFKDVYTLKLNRFFDNRGDFLKVFNKDFFTAHNINFDIAEFFYSTSNKNVIRGMHFQLPPYQHSKLVFAMSGSVLDVIVDLRKNSETFRNFFKVRLSNEENNALFIPEGFAHGFLSLEDNTVMCYLQSSCYNKQSDSGIKYNSFGFDWCVKKPIVSERDLDFQNLKDFVSPF